MYRDRTSRLVWVGLAWVGSLQIHLNTHGIVKRILNNDKYLKLIYYFFLLENLIEIFSI
jgi:hypothetical protein